MARDTSSPRSGDTFGIPDEGSPLTPHVTGTGDVPWEGADQPAREGSRPSQAGYDLSGPGTHGTLRTRGLGTGLRLLLRPALDRMPADMTSLNRLRALTSGAGRAAALETTNDWSDDGPVPGLWVGRKRFFASDKVLYLLHGGGFTFGSPWSHKALASRLAGAAGIPVFLPDYRLAPEHPYPAAVEDAVSGWNWLQEMGFDPADIVVCGDSAGGNLALQLVDHLHRAGAEQPGGVVLMSPWVDMDITDMTERDRRRKDPFLAISLVEVCRNQYAPDLDPADPRISPVYLTPSPQWPPFLIQCGGEEIFRGGIERLAEGFAEHGVRHHFQVWPHQFHVFQAFHPLVPEARAATRDAGAFIRGCLR